MNMDLKATNEGVKNCVEDTNRNEPAPVSMTMAARYLSRVSWDSEVYLMSAYSALNTDRMTMS